MIRIEGHPRSGKSGRLSPSERKALIIDSAARWCLESESLEIPFAVIAERVGVARSLIYHYYPNREALLADVIRSQADVLMKRLGAADPGKGRAYLETLMRIYVDFVAERPGVITEVLASPEASRMLRAQIAAGLPELFRFVAGALDIRQGTPEAAAAASALEFVRHFLIFERMSAGGNADGFARYCADIIMTAVDRVPAGKGAPRSA